MFVTHDSGYIIISKTKNLEKVHSAHGIVHGKCYKNIFNEEPPTHLVAGGFARYKGRWKFNSLTFNAKLDGFSDFLKRMTKCEKIWLAEHCVIG